MPPGTAATRKAGKGRKWEAASQAPREKKPAARRRAATRTLRRSGDLVIRPSLALGFALFLFFAGAFSGGLVGVLLHESGLITALLGKPEAPNAETRYLTSLRPLAETRGLQETVGQALPSGASPESPAALQAPPAGATQVAALGASALPDRGDRPAEAGESAPAWRAIEPRLSEPQAPVPPPLAPEDVDRAAARQGALQVASRVLQASVPEVPALDPPADGRAAHTVYDEPVSLAHLLARLDSPAQEEPSPAALPAPGEAAPLAETDGTPAWQRNAVQVADIGGRPMVALVIDDLGLNRPNTWRAIELPGPLTLAFLTYAGNIETMLEQSRAAGHELMVHVPMQPRDNEEDPGPRALRVGQSADEVNESLTWGLERFGGYVGINNHMGSAFSSWRPGMERVLAEVKRRGLLFLDSKTTEVSVGAPIAREMGIAYAERDVFIDNDRDDRRAIRRQLEQLEAIARRHGHAVGIAHPHRGTLEVLADWLPEATQRGLVLVPISAVVRHRIEIARADSR